MSQLCWLLDLLLSLLKSFPCLVLQAGLRALVDSTLPLQGSANRSKQTAAAKAAAELKKADKANKAAANKLLVADSRAAAHAEALTEQARAFKKEQPIETAAPSALALLSTPEFRSELVKACVTAARSTAVSQLFDQLMEQIRGELQPLTGPADDIIKELRRLATTLEARPAAPDGLETIAVFIEKHMMPLPDHIKTLDRLI
jgi:hypothetical protein